MNVLDVARIGRSREKRDARERRQHLLKDLKPLADEIGKNGGQSGDVAARSRQACDHSRLDRIDGGDEDDGHCAGGVACRQHCRRARGHDHVDLAADQFGREVGELLDVLGNPEVKHEALALDVPELAQSVP